MEAVVLSKWISAYSKVIVPLSYTIVDTHNFMKSIEYYKHYNVVSAEKKDTFSSLKEALNISELGIFNTSWGKCFLNLSLAY